MYVEPSRGYIDPGEAQCTFIFDGDRCVNAEGHASSHQFVPLCPHPADRRWFVVGVHTCGVCGAVLDSDPKLREEES